MLEPNGIHSDEKFLVGVSGIPDYCVNLWDWEDERLLNHLPLNQPHPAADQVTVLLVPVMLEGRIQGRGGTL